MESAEILQGLWIAIAVMLIVILYHVLFVVVDLRKVMRRVEDITAQIEETVMTPISIADSLLQHAVAFIEGKQETEKKEKKPAKKKKK